MNFNLFRFELRLSRFTLWVIALGLLAFEFLLVAIFSGAQLDQNMAGIFKILPKAIRSLMGGAYVDLLTVKGFLAFGFTHPLALVLLCAGAITPASRSAVGSAGDGLTDMILAQPVSRIWVLLSRGAAGEVCGLFMVLGMWLGHLAGVTFIDLKTVPPRMPYFYVAVNAYAFFLAVQGLGFLAAVSSRRRAGAVGISIAVLAFMLFASLCGELWKGLDFVAYLSLLHYYVPGKVVYFETFPLADVAVLLGFYLASMGVALWIYHKRDM